MKKALPMFCAVVIIVASLGGCQATPDEPVVIQKDMEQMIVKGVGDETATSIFETETAIEAMPEREAVSIEDYAELCAHYGVPERFQTTIAERNLNINCDVQIELPNTLTLPMARVVAGKFSQDRVYALFNALCGDTQMYLVPGIRDKVYYEQEILKRQAELSTTTDEKSIQIIKTIISELKAQYEKAPETLEATPSDGTLQTREIDNDGASDAATGTLTMIETTSDPYQVYDVHTTMQLVVYNDIDYKDTSVYSFEDEDGNIQVIAPRSGSRLWFEREGTDTRYGRKGSVVADVTELSLMGGAVSNCLLTTTPEQARETVEQLMADACLDDMMIDTVSLYSSKRNLPSPEIIEKLEEEGVNVLEEAENETQAYVFRLLRKVSDVKVESTHDSSETSMDGMSYGKEWWYESLLVAVDDKGIANVYWTGPLDVTEVLSEDTEILPWSDIEDVFDKMMVIKHADYVNDEDMVHIEIMHVSLSLQRIMQRDSFTTGLLVPVWNFYGTTAYNDESYTQDCGYRPLLSINAIDGSVIDVDSGY